MNTTETPTKVSQEVVNQMLSLVRYDYFRPEGTNNVLCVARMPDGYTMAVGQGSCIYGPNFSEVHGKNAAYENARKAAEDHAWMYQGILLRERLIALDLIKT